MATLEVKARLCDYFSHGVLRLKISYRAEYFVVVGKDTTQDTQIILFDLQKSISLSESGRKDDKYFLMKKERLGQVLSICFDANDTSVLLSTLHQIWQVNFTGETTEIKKFLWKKIQPETITCMLSYKSEIIYGGSIKGNLFRWDQGTVV